MMFKEKILKLSVCIIGALCIAANLSALEVSESELESVGSPDIVFINYTGPYTVINTMAEIRGIGTSLGRVIQAGGKNAGYGDKYRIVHAVDDAVKNGLDGDILLLGNNAGVDHIRLLRTIIAAYLTSAYGYSSADASTLATFITVYNAVYRGSLTPWQEKYKKVVLENLTATSAGLATNYSEWPGKTQIVIPLTNRPGTLSTIDTTIISDKNVVDSMRDNPDRNVGDRRDMVDLKEREASAAQDRAQTAQREATDAQKQSAAEQNRLAAEQETLRQQQAAAAKAQQDAAAAAAAAEAARQTAQQNPDDIKAQQEAAAKEAVADEAASLAEEKQMQADLQTQKTSEQQQAAQDAASESERLTQLAAEEQAFADKKQTEAQQERGDIAKDQKEVIAEQDAAARSSQNGGQNGYTVKIIDTVQMLSGMVLVDLSTGKTVRQSPVNSIRGRTVLQNGADYVAVAGKSTGNGAIRLVVINGQSLDIVSQSAEDVAPQAVLVSADNGYFTVIKSGADWIIGKYSGTLELLARSAVKVIPETAITITSKGLLVQAADNTIHLLNTADLTEIK